MVTRPCKGSYCFAGDGSEDTSSSAKRSVRRRLTEPHADDADWTHGEYKSALKHISTASARADVLTADLHRIQPSSNGALLRYCYTAADVFCSATVGKPLHVAVTKSSRR